MKYHVYSQFAEDAVAQGLSWLTVAATVGILIAHSWGWIALWGASPIRLCIKHPDGAGIHVEVRDAY